jgi:Electron transfer DM13
VSFLGDLGSAILAAAYTYRIPLAIGAVILAIALGVVVRRCGWLDRVRAHPRLTAAILVPALALALPIGWHLGSPLVLSTAIDEPAPIAAATAAPASPATSSVPSAAAWPTAGPSATPVPLALAGSFRGSDEFHFGRGTARLIETSPGRFVVRLENFAVRNGPDLYVYLSPSADGYASDAIELGRLRADTGNQNYAVPAGALDGPAAAASVVIWCKQFSHLFATATLAAG